MATAELSHVADAALEPNRAAPASPLSRWIAGPAAIALVALVAVLYQPTALALSRLWNAEPRYLFGYLIPALSLLAALAAWRRYGGPLQRDVARVDVRRGSMLFLLGAVAHIAAMFVVNLPLDVFGLVLMLRGMVQLGGGGALARRYDFAVGLLLFLIPLSLNGYAPLTTTLQQGVAAASASLLDAAGVPVFHEGNLLQVGDFMLFVTSASSGLLQIQGVLALCLTVGFIGGLGRRFNVFLVLMSLPIAMGVNILRIVSAGLAYSESGRPAAERVLQTYDGWVPVAVAAGLVVVAALAFYGIATLTDRTTKESA